ncbi:MAG: homoserine kinase [Brevundimonas sp.]|uniref:homoserine kinase n=1 Tax=Brevundimonas sp. TaxID=1871086 RepID=UPI002ABBA5C4|nr:homoserine kinase [Brevundimonas sp.]MDZ4110378.1 homoserine kinase [Brevundimonas sp.]
MAVFTPVEEAEADPFIRRFGLGPVRALTPIAEGVENTNYRLDTDQGRFVLTLFEGRTDETALPFCLGLTRHAAERGLPCARALTDAEGRSIGRLNGRPAAILNWLPGAAKTELSLADQAAGGALLARLHLAAADYPAVRANPVGAAARKSLFERCATRAAGADRRILERLAPWVADDAPDPAAGLPRGPIHADYFPDNLLFEAGAPSGLIDFYFACIDAFAYDLAIALSAWGFDAKGAPLPAALNAFQSGYESIRPLSPAERAALGELGAVAAVRFTLTRLHDRLFHDPLALVTPKDPASFLRRLDWWTGAALAA